MMLNSDLSYNGDKVDEAVKIRAEN